MKRILSHLATDWYKYLLELIVITAGVLGAFALNSWKEDRAEQGEEATILRGLKQEFEVNLAEVNRNIELNSQTTESCSLAIELIRTEKPFANQRYFDSLFHVVVFMFGTFDAQTGLVDEVIGSGKLSIIKDPQIRNRLTSVSGILDNLEEDYEIRGNFYTHEILPYLIQYLPLANQDQYMDFSSWSNSYNSRKIPKSPFMAKSGKIDLLQLENYIYQHKINNDFVNLDEYQIRIFLIETLEIINANLKKTE